MNRAKQVIEDLSEMFPFSNIGWAYRTEVFRKTISVGDVGTVILLGSYAPYEGGVFGAVVTCSSRTADGEWSGSKQGSKEFKSKGDAEAWLRKISSEIRFG